jgi:hypothetical protein
MSGLSLFHTKGTQQDEIRGDLGVLGNAEMRAFLLLMATRSTFYYSRKRKKILHIVFLRRFSATECSSLSIACAPIGLSTNRMRISSNLVLLLYSKEETARHNRTEKKDNNVAMSRHRIKYFIHDV